MAKKEALLELAKKGTVPAKTLQLAMVSSEEEACAQQEKIERNLKRVTLCYRASCVFGAAIALAASHHLATNLAETLAGAFLFYLIWLLVQPLIFGIAEYCIIGSGSPSIVAPIAGTGECNRAARCLADSSEAVEWRDLALKERDQLRGFDVAVMVSIRYAAMQEAREAEERAHLEEVCKQVHAVSAS